MSQRWTRKDIKRDEFAEFWERAIEVVQARLRGILLTVGAIAVVGLVTLAIFVFSQHRRAQAGEALAGALRVAAAPVVEDGAVPDHPRAPSFATEDERDARALTLFSEVYDRFGNQDAGGVAALFLASAASEEGDFEEVRRLWTEYLDRDEDNMAAAEVRLNLLDLDRQQGKTEEVITKLEGMLASDDKPLPGDVILYELALTYEVAGREEDAQSQYQRIIEEYPQSAYRAAAQQRVAAVAGSAGLPGASIGS